MKTAFKRLYDVPLLGYLLRAIVRVAKLPIHMRSHEESLRELQEWLPHAERRIRQAASRQDSTESRMVALEATFAEQQRVASEAHGQATYLTHRMDSVAQQAAQTENSISRLQAGLDRHLPTVLGLVSSGGVAVREFQREQLALRNETSALSVKLAVLESRTLDSARAIQVLESTSDATRDARHSVEQRLTELDKWVALAERRLPSPEASSDPSDPERSVVSLRAAIDELRGHVSYLLQRVEFVRREALFELRYGRSQSTSQAIDIKPRVLNEEKVAQASRMGLRINVGSGHIPIEGYVNVDLRELPGVDVIAEAGHMPFERGSIAELHSAHLLEHFPREQLRREILPYWRSLLRPSGVLRAVVPDAATMIDKYKSGEMPWEDLREVTFGGQDYAGDFHYDMFTPESLKALLEEAGFEDVSFPVTGRLNGRCYEMAVFARVGPQ